MKKRMLLATDGSESARAAEAIAIDLCNHMGECVLEVVTVIPPRVYKTGFSRSQPYDTFSSRREVAEATTMLAEVGQRIRSQLTNEDAEVFEQLLEHSSPAKAIIEEAEVAGQCGMIIMGARGLGGLEKLALGSVSTQVLHGARCPVMIVRP